MDDEPPDQVFSAVSSLKRPISEDDQFCWLYVHLADEESEFTNQVVRRDPPHKSVLLMKMNSSSDGDLQKYTKLRRPKPVGKLRRAFPHCNLNPASEQPHCK